MTATSWLYRLLRTRNDIHAATHGTHAVVRRAGRRVYGRASGRLARRIFG